MKITKAIGDFFRPGSRENLMPEAYGMTMDGGVSRDAYQIDDETLSQHQFSATVFTCVDMIAKAVANVNFIAEDDYWNETFTDPNIFQSRYDFWYSVVWDMVFFGNAYILRSKKKKGSKGILAPIDPKNVKPQGNMMKPRYLLKDEQKEYGPDEIIHIRHGGGSGLKAIGRTAAGWRRIMALESCDKEIESVFSNGVSMSHVLHGGHSDQESVKKMLISIKNAFGVGGKSRAGVVGITGGFRLDTIKGATPADSDLRNLRVDLIRETSSLYGIPPFSAGGSSDTKYSNTVARHAQLIKDAHIPACENLRSKLEHNLGTKVTYNPEDLLKGDFVTAMDLAIKAAGGPVRTPNEAREHYLDLDRIEGGDELRNTGDMSDDDRRGENSPDGRDSDR